MFYVLNQERGQWLARAKGYCFSITDAQPIQNRRLANAIARTQSTNLGQVHVVFRDFPVTYTKGTKSD